MMSNRYFGHVFSGRYKSLVIDGRWPGYLRAACDYVHLNPVRAGLVAAEQPLSAFGWSNGSPHAWRCGSASYVSHLLAKS